MLIAMTEVNPGQQVRPTVQQKVADFMRRTGPGQAILDFFADVLVGFSLTALEKDQDFGVELESNVGTGILAGFNGDHSQHHECAGQTGYLADCFC
jgi:hypothetical protein